MDDRTTVVPIRRGTVYCPVAGLRLGTVVGADPSGGVLVDFEGNEGGPVAARLTAAASEGLRQGPAPGREVLLAFPDQESGSPVILDVLHSPDAEAERIAGATLDRQGEEELHVDRRRIVLNAEEEVVLRCGEASITLTRSGKVLIRGAYLVSRASGTNSIKGSSVRIN